MSGVEVVHVTDLGDMQRLVADRTSGPAVFRRGRRALLLGS